MLGYSNALFRRYSNITNARVAYYLLNPEHLRAQAAAAAAANNNNNGPAATNNAGVAGNAGTAAVNAGNAAPAGRAAEAATSRGASTSRKLSFEAYRCEWSPKYWVNADDFVEVTRHMSELDIGGSSVASSSVSSVSSVTQVAGSSGKAVASSCAGTSEPVAGPSGTNHS